MAAEAGSASRRLFFALWPAPEQAAALYRLGTDAWQRCGGRRMAPQTLHLTLAFLGQVKEARLPELRAIAAAVAGAPGSTMTGRQAAGEAGAVKSGAFDLILDRLDYWRHNRILWAGCETVPPGLEVLAEHLQQALGGAGYELEQRHFAAHVTLLRNARCPASLPLACPLTWPVTEFVLVESCPSTLGADYRVLARWPLS